MSRTDNMAEIEAAIDRRICVRCDSEPRVVWLGGLTGESAYGMRCNCEANKGLKPLLGAEIGYVKRRYARMVQSEAPLAPDPSRGDDLYPPKEADR